MNASALSGEYFKENPVLQYFPQNSNTSANIVNSEEEQIHKNGHCVHYIAQLKVRSRSMLIISFDKLS